MILVWTGKKLKVVDTSVLEIQVPKYNNMNRAYGCVSLALCCATACRRAHASSGCTRVHAVTSDRSAASRFTDNFKIWPMKITHCDQRKRHFGISNILNQTNYSNELDAKRTSEYSVNSFQHYFFVRLRSCGMHTFFFAQSSFPATTLDKKKRTIPEIRGEKNAVPSCDIMLDDARSAQGKSRGQSRMTLPCVIVRHRAWYLKIEQRSSRRESRGWFFFFVQGSSFN